MQRKEVAELVDTNQIHKEEWINYLTKLLKEEDMEELLNTTEIITNENIEIEPQDIQSSHKNERIEKFRTRRNLT